MRQITAQQITATVKDLCIKANTYLPDDVRRCNAHSRNHEDWPLAQQVLDDIIENDRLARQQGLPVCQDTGVACVFMQLGQEVHITDGDANEAINEGVRQGYAEGFLRKSVVAGPLERINTKDNTPAMVYWELVPGNQLAITVAPKGFGSENMSRIAMLSPADGEPGVEAFVLETVRLAGPNPCPPIVVGVGIGGTFDKAALLAKKALLRPLDSPHPLQRYAALENRLLKNINALGIGPQGFGGGTTALAVLVETMPTHIAGLPCAVNINCHVARHASEVV